MSCLVACPVLFFCLPSGEKKGKDRSQRNHKPVGINCDGIRQESDPFRDINCE